MPKTILVIDDEPKIRILLRRCFEADGYKVLEAGSVGEADLQMQNHAVDLLMLDLQLGSENGLEIATRIRAKSQIPIIIVTGKGDVIDKVVGLEMGADDYISKPFHIREVLARVHSVLRRSEMKNIAEKPHESVNDYPKSDSIREFNGWRSNLSRHELTNPDGEVCDLTTADFKLLSVFLKSPKRVLSRDQIMDQINGYDWNPNDRTIDNQVARLRKRIEDDPASPRIIKTIRGVGYMFATDVTIANA